MKAPDYIPIWFIAAYPEIVMWLRRIQRRFLEDEDKKGLFDFEIQAYGIHPTDTKKDLVDSNNNHSPTCNVLPPLLPIAFLFPSGADIFVV